MFSLFNKTQRITDKIFSELVHKIEQSKDIKCTYDGNEECFHLDDIDIVMNTVTHALTVTSGDKELLSLDCSYDLNDKNARFRSNGFSMLLDKARQKLDKQTTQSEKLKQATAKAQAQIDEKNNKHQEQQTQAAILKNALAKIQGK